VFTIKTNVMGTLNMLGLATRSKARILLASTSEVRTRFAPFRSTGRAKLFVNGASTRTRRCTAIRWSIRKRNLTVEM
jgi:nucleoside-diphosphate-sugar epimerase